MSVNLSQCSVPPSGDNPTSLESSEYDAPAQCSAPPQTTLSREEEETPPTPSGTDGYTTLNNWGPVIRRGSTKDCIIGRTVQEYSSADHNSQQWNAIMETKQEQRKPYNKYNSNIIEGNTIIGNNYRRANYGNQYNCHLDTEQNCGDVPITGDGTVASSQDTMETSVCLNVDNEILGIGKVETEAECASKCSSDKKCAGYTFSGTQCILQNSQLVTKHPGFVLGQYSAGVQTKVRHCNFQNGECVQEEQEARSCHGPFTKDRFPITECYNQKEGEDNRMQKLQVLAPFQLKSPTTIEPGVPPPARPMFVFPQQQE